MATAVNGADAWERQLVEACDSLWDALVDPREAYADDEGWWTRVGAVGGAGGAAGGGGPAGSLDEEQLAAVRLECRRLAAINEFAINGLENRVSYLVGSGHTYRVAAKKGMSAADRVVDDVQEVLDEFVELNAWQMRQQEVVRRLDRDGEALLRFFADERGRTRVRFVEPEQVRSPGTGVGERASGFAAAASRRASFGILTDPADVETVRGYYVDDELVDAGQVQHRKANVDANVKRGLPLYFPVRKNLRRVERLLRNMSALAEIQSAIALIRKHRSALRNGVEQFAADVAGGGGPWGQAPRLAGGKVGGPLYGPGTILDAPSGLEYDFPAAGVNAANFVTVLQAELRAIAARLVMPEFMFTSDASNANYSSTLVAEGPAVKMFERLQAALKNDDRQVMWRVVANAAAAGQLPADVRRRVEIQISLPSLQVRDALKECQMDRIAFEKGILSPQSWSQRLGLDYDQERHNWEVHNASGQAGMAGASGGGGMSMAGWT